MPAAFYRAAMRNVTFRRRRLGFLTLLWLAGWQTGLAQELAVTGWTQPAVAGAVVRFRLNALNPSGAPAAWTFPGKIVCRLTTTQGEREVAANLADAANATSHDVPPGGFVRAEYTLPLPENCSGEVVVQFRGLALSRAVLNVQPPPAPPDTRKPEESFLHWFLRDAEPKEAGTRFEPGRFFKEHFFGYEPFYFIAGTESPNAKFQISFKYRLLNEDGALAHAAPAMKGLHLAYTQTSLWDWNAESRPFYDSSYKPEVLYAWDRVVGGGPTNWFRLDLQGGVQHESNGKSGDDSRSLNIVYLRPTLVFGRDDTLQLKLIPRVWAYVGDLEDNPDLPDYRGYADLRAVLGWPRGFQLSALGRLGDDGDHGSLQFDATYPMMRLLGGSFSLYLHAQYFTGYGESLLGYRERSSMFRVGISLYR
jgi:phospholipase A1